MESRWRTLRTPGPAGSSSSWGSRGVGVRRPRCPSLTARGVAGPPSVACPPGQLPRASQQLDHGLSEAGRPPWLSLTPSPQC